MTFARSESQTLIENTAARLLADQNDAEARRERLSRPQPERLALWPAMAEQGILGAAFGEDAGGFGGTLRDLAIVMREVGRRLVVEPVLYGSVAARILLRAGDADAVAAFIGGERVLTLAHMEGLDPFSPPATVARAGGDGHTVSGRKLAVRHADCAHAIVVSATLEGEPAWLLVEADARGVAADAFRLMDASGAATLTFTDAPARLLLRGADALDEALSWLLAGLAAEAVGIVEALNEATFAYLGTRKQFGVPLATFQALQHRAADMYAASEQLRCLTSRTIDAIDSGSPVRHALASAAKVLACEHGRRVGHESVQLHGGMGVSDELDVSHFMRRLTTLRGELGNAELHRARFARLTQGAESLLEESEDLAAFRLEVREFVNANLPADIAAKMRLGLDYEKSDFVRWQKVLQQHGWFATAWPREHGGADWPLQRRLVFLQEAALCGAPPISPYGISMVGPVLFNFGNAAQCARHLPGILQSDVWWCQGYSEPNSGSDLASLKTTAVRDGDHYVVNGTKMWTTEAHWADWMHCLVRTDKEAKPQKGISFLLIDMRTPGISIRPIVTIDGQHHTNQIFFDNVRVPAENLVGQEGQGWTIAKFLLSNERVAIADTGPKLMLLRTIKRMLDETDASESVKVPLRNKLADAEIQLLALCSIEDDYVHLWSGGGSKEGPQASVLKIRGTEILQLLTEVALEIEGPLGTAHDPRDLHLPPEAVKTPAQHASLIAHQYLYGRAWSIFGGTNEIQRGIIARAILPG